MTSEPIFTFSRGEDITDCPTCNGTGGDPDADDACTTCDGYGWLNKTEYDEYLKDLADEAAFERYEDERHGIGFMKRSW